MKTTSHKLVNKCISDSHVYCRFNGYLVCCCLSQSYKSKFAIWKNGESERTNKITEKRPTFFSLQKVLYRHRKYRDFFIIVCVCALLKYISHDYWLFWHLQVECVPDSSAPFARRTPSSFSMHMWEVGHLFECVFFPFFSNYVPMINSISICQGSTANIKR